MKPAFRFAFFAAMLAACAHSTSLDETAGYGEDDDDGGTVNVDGGNGDGQGTEIDASIDSGTGPGDSGEGEGGGHGDADSGPTHPCDGVVCNEPPANVCADAGKLRVYEPVGTCDEGECRYESATEPCAGGCASGACIDNPCAGVSCNTAPKSQCKNEQYLTVYQAPGSCTNGKCSYTSIDKFCAGGCLNDVCNGDPCEGKVCNQPTASHCSGPDTLITYSLVGTCSGGACSYAPLPATFCPHGCSAGKCMNDPCAGVSCKTPPARRCKDANTATTFPATGSCSNGVCLYPATDQHCPNGCLDGYCRDCSADVHCGSGRWCSGSTCVSCNDDVHCGASCTNCGASGKVCNAGACVECTKDSQCPGGQTCSNNVCVACDTAQKCGPTCMSCSGTTPTCNGSACVCSGSSCGANQQCVGGACSVCKTDAACGASCSPCGGATPFCLDKGSSSQCVACRTDGHCGADEVCDRVTGTCGPKCPVTAQTVFSDNFGSPSSKTWTTGADALVNTSRWRAFTTAKHGVRINGGQLEITNKASGSPTHGQGYAYVKTGGAGSAFDNTFYDPVLKQNSGRELVWSFNMHRTDPYDDSTYGGFKCSSSSSQNGITVGLAFVLATDSAAGLNASASTCSRSATSTGYAVVLGGNRKVRLVRFDGGLRNGTITDLIVSSDLKYVDNYVSARVTYNATNDQWKLEVRDDGVSKFTDPAGGTFKFTGVATDATYVNKALEYMGPYFQTGCSGLCSSIFDAHFDDITVSARCAP